MDTNPNLPQPSEQPDEDATQVVPTAPPAPTQQFQQAPAPGGPAKPQRSRGKLIGLIAAGVVALIVILGVGSELYIRNHYESCIGDNVKNGTKATSVDVSFAKKPMLLQASGKIPSITMHIDGLNGFPGMTADVLLSGVQPDGDNTADDVRIVGKLSLEGIQAKVAGVPMMSNPTAALKPAENTIEVTGTAVILPVTINLTPTIENNKVVVTPSKTSIMGFGVPDDLVKELVSSLADIPTPEGMTVQNLKMSDDAITLEYVGKNIPLGKLGATGDTANTVNCSIL